MVAAAVLVSACDTTFPQTTLRIATGGQGGVYNQLGGTLAEVWRGSLGFQAVDVQRTRGSQDNVNRLHDGTADVAFSAADVATSQPREKAAHLRALGRIYDDYLHVVVRSDSPVTSLAGLRGRRIAVGTRDSGTWVIANRVLTAAGVAVDQDEINLNDAKEKLRTREIDGFFWSGGLPSAGVTELAQQGLIKLLDLTEELPVLRKSYPIYNTASIPAATYHTDGAVKTLSVPNFLLVTDRMPDDVAEALTHGLYDARQQLGSVNPAALAIDVLPGIETDPVPLHPGALRFYRENKI
jgi:TRAP transporter TAXI family solute receptor